MRHHPFTSARPGALCRWATRLGSAALAFAALLLGGCATTAPKTASQRTGGYEAPAARDMMPERPGLGTGWGEERDSQTSPTRFVRSDGNHPDWTGRLYYNDEAGVKAMLAYEGGSSRRSRGPEQISGGLVSVGLRSASGGWLDGYGIGGGRRFVVGERGERYEIVVRNDTAARLEVVLSVDGLDVMDGRGASFGKRGYIIAAGDTITIDGFRTSSATVAAFRFSSVSRSYAALRHGDTRNVGVIGIAVFTERYAEPWRFRDREPQRRRDANPFPGRRWAVPPT
ncbi:MAG TPA: hypothetical protein VFD27_03640 [Chthoniobacteraceae bacterium]|jgi:hypothetical protein|nr:hypothetical protein [Chthoniobacteraceae bacterium]